MSQPFNFGPVPRIAFGIDRVDGLARDLARLAKDGAGVLLVTDPGVVAAGLAERVERLLAKDGIAVTRFSDLRSDPRAASIDAAAALARDTKAGAVVALGGGSALDVGKLAAAIVAGDEPAEHYALGANPLPRGGLPWIAVPTTAGTGSEATRTSVFTSADGRKLWAWGERLRATLAILDPTLTTGLPAGLTAATGADAMVHAIEGMTVRRANPVADALCLHAIRLIAGGALAHVLATPDDLEARGQMMQAAMLAGMGFDSTGTGIAHAMGHALGALAGVHHGRAVGLCLNAALAWNAEAAPAAHAAVARALGVPCDGLDDAAAADRAAPAFTRFLESIGLPLSLTVDGLGREDANRLAELTMAEENAPMREANCRSITAADAQAIAERLLAA